MAGGDQAEQDKERQAKWRQEYYDKFLGDRARQSLVKGNMGTSSGIVGRKAGELANKETFNKFEKALGKGAGEIKAQEHGTGAWMVGLVLAIAKDLLDIGTMETVSWIDWTIDAMLGVGLYCLFRGSAKTGAKLIKSVGPTILEMIPGLGFLPIWSFTVAYMYFKSQQEE